MNIYQQIYPKVISKLENNLPAWLYYHSTEHTKYVLEQAVFIAEKEKVEKNDLYLLKVAALYHDTGFIINREEHEAISCNIATEELKEYGLDSEEIEQICEMIMATKIPQKPTSFLSRILADADLEYLGTEKFMSFSQNLYKELLHYTPDLTQDQWNEIQVKFISNHHYHTAYCKQNREPKKQKNLKMIMKQLNNAD